MKIYPRDQIKHFLLIDVIAIVYLCYFVLSTRSDLGLLGSLMILSVFLISFYIALWHRNIYLLAAVVSGLGTIAVLSIYIDPNLLMFGFIFADLLGRSKSKWQIGVGTAAIALALVAGWGGIGNFIANHIMYLPIMIIQMLLPSILYIRARAASLQGQLDAANEQLEHYVLQEERHRIARDLHDTLGQTLTMIKLKSELAARWVDKDPVQAKEELKDIMDTSRIALKQVRELVSEMKFISLSSELAHSRKLLHTAGIELEIVEQGTPPLLSSVEETMMALSVREAITNMIKHSQAQHCTIRLQAADSRYTICITDDGVGLNQKEGGNGILSMKERMQALNGTLTVECSSTGGTAVTMMLPLYQLRKESAAT
ncbi:sensor histidine kinase [Paenibacillus alvei]|uniref:histidine kinase n=1 Tax=Paenibacillus alvei TaxID=44250 RepID=A0AAP6ZYJ2_PAEAL|nr:sensor histidine kinase [Paenibacillus alvei]MBG9734463.1 histidine kinase [Paenibacillus alvei]MBG9744233.1 histidine kinase [Paenibacillus alvei]MCY9578091.1 sensor histidine kinase [Paenibacillus alvei]MCY9585385.1 sensor histidine kinase [Paenibacillus alvei]NEZ44796.1 sensor histidine kinase [Paenibacillus alvei]